MSNRSRWSAPANKKFIRLPFGFVMYRPTTPPPTPVLPDPLVAWASIQKKGHGAFHANLEQCVIFNGCSFSQFSWHPFVQAAKEHLQTGVTNYEDSSLYRYYAAWQPSDAGSALVGAEDGPDWLQDYPPYLVHAPWLKTDPDTRLQSISKIIAEENALLGEEGLSIEDGYGLQGPVSDRKGRLEYKRLLGLLDSIRSNGYDRHYGDTTAQILVRGDELRFRIVHGHHRTAVMSALGYSGLVVVPTMIVDNREVDEWPQVKNGYWKREQALKYFDHHFDSDPLAWAEDLGLT